MTYTSAPQRQPERPDQDGDPATSGAPVSSGLPTAVVSVLRIAPWVMFGIVGLLVVWTTVLDSTLHGRAIVRNWSTTWIGLDLAEAAMLALTGILLLRRSRLLSPAAAVTATLFLVDAWFDVLTSSSASGSNVSLFLAVLIEIPAAIALGVLSWWSLRSAYFEADRIPDREPAIKGEQASR